MLKDHVYNTARVGLAWASAQRDAHWNDFPLGRQPRADAAEYVRLFEAARSWRHPEVDAVEERMGFRIDRAWLDELALHTQIVIKKSDLLYVHGRLLYAILRRYLADSGVRRPTILETGTARGFSALCMAKALADANVRGRVITIDVLPHLRRMYWNCIDDGDGPKSRAELLAPWSDLLEDILFVQGDTLEAVSRLGVERVHFAFLDAQHTHRDVLAEFGQVVGRQQPGDMVFFDDVSPADFPGVVKAVNEIESGGFYALERLQVSDHRGYAWGRRVMQAANA